MTQSHLFSHVRRLINKVSSLDFPQEYQSSISRKKLEPLKNIKAPTERSPNSPIIPSNSNKLSNYTLHDPILGTSTRKLSSNIPAGC
jgi:hypothetical protein